MHFAMNTNSWNITHQKTMLTPQSLGEAMSLRASAWQSTYNFDYKTNFIFMDSHVSPSGFLGMTLVF